MSDRFNYDVAAIVHPMSDVLVRVGIYQDKDVLEALSILREFADGESDQQEREGMHKVLDALETFYKSREEDTKPPKPPEAITFRCVKCNKKWVGTDKRVCPHCHHMVFGYGHHRW